MEYVTLNSVGTYKIVEQDDVNNVIDTALFCGYRSFDTAQMYNNEAQIGVALQTLLPKHGLKREDIFLTSKLNTCNQGTERASLALKKSLADLQTPYLDLFLIHWPFADGVDKENEANINADLRAQSWKVLETAKTQGKVRSIGVSNYVKHHLEDMLPTEKETENISCSAYPRHLCQIPPAVDQLEMHPYLFPQQMLQYLQSKGIQFQAYSPLGSPKSKDVLNEPCIMSLSQKYGKEPAQVVLRWAIQHGVCVIPKSSNPERIRANIQIFDFTLMPREMEMIDSLNKNHHYAADPALIP